jgi:glycogen debranching enzyme
LEIYFLNFKSLAQVVLLFLISSIAYSQIKEFPSVNFKGDAQIEVGNHYMGIELHHSSPMLQRISFYYPVANSIDLSNDYWKRDSTFIMAVQLSIDSKKEWIGFDRYELISNPYSIKFQKNDAAKSIKISYEFCKEKPAMVITYEIKNLGREIKEFEFETQLETSLKTCHSYKSKEIAWTESANGGSTIYTNFDDKETQNAQIFVSNAGEKPIDYSSISYLNNISNKWWQNIDWNKNEKNIPKENQQRPAIYFLYRKKIESMATLKVVQIIGMCRQDEGKKIVNHLLSNYKKEVSDFEKYVLGEINKTVFRTNENDLDKTYAWAKAVLSVNQHYIDGSIQPMPCPAEYNFYFTHDVLLTDLAAVNFDLKRVKDNLQFIIKHATKDFIIPHAYYWRDTSYVTEYCTPDNWNHFWFIILSGSYLRHSSDKTLLKSLYPYLTKSLEQTLLNRKENLMWAYRPDWWDIGRNFGPRSFMTIQAIKAIREYIYISIVLGENESKLAEYEMMADDMQKKLNEKLWSDELKYLVNYWEDGSKDQHFYIGSLLAAAYDLLSDERKKELIKTASQKLLDPKLGIYTVFPMDFEKLIDFMKFAGNEAGDPFKYINGGIWSHGNAWYILALIATQEKEKAFNFIKNVMTLDGVINSPNGQPAMYEYRNSNKFDSSVYGKIDKPQFMWAAGWYIYSLYHLFGIKENEWNIILDPYLNLETEKCEFDLLLNGDLSKVNIEGKGLFLEKILFDGKDCYSPVLPLDLNPKNIKLVLGKIKHPYISSINAVLLSCSYLNKSLISKIKAFTGKEVTLKIISPLKPRSISFDKNNIKDFSLQKITGGFEIILKHKLEKKISEIIVKI